MEGLRLVGADVAGKSVLLKPNLVEIDPASGINTDPRLIAATVAVMKRLGARSVTVGEGPGHWRDMQYVLEVSGLGDLLRRRECSVRRPEPRRASRARRSNRVDYQLGELWLPTEVLRRGRRGLACPR